VTHILPSLGTTGVFYSKQYITKDYKSLFVGLELFFVTMDKSPSEVDVKEAI